MASEPAGGCDRLPGVGAHPHRALRHHPLGTAEPGDHGAAAPRGEHRRHQGVAAAATVEAAHRLPTTTAAGDGGYDTSDLDRQRSLEFAVQATPGLLEPFLVRITDPPGAYWST